jgi:hypothetical protein
MVGLCFLLSVVSIQSRAGRQRTPFIVIRRQTKQRYAVYCEHRVINTTSSFGIAVRAVSPSWTHPRQPVVSLESRNGSVIVLVTAILLVIVVVFLIVIVVAFAHVPSSTQSDGARS